MEDFHLPHPPESPRNSEVNPNTLQPVPHTGQGFAPCRGCLSLYRWGNFGAGFLPLNSWTAVARRAQVASSLGVSASLRLSLYVVPASCSQWRLKDADAWHGTLPQFVPASCTVDLGSRSFRVEMWWTGTTRFVTKSLSLWLQSQGYFCSSPALDSPKPSESEIESLYL